MDHLASPYFVPRRTHRALGSRAMLGIAALSLACSVTVGANADEPSAAEQLFSDGRAALVDHQYDVACAKFRESDKLDPAVGTHLNLANCEELRGHIAVARVLFAEAIKQLPADDPRYAIAKDRFQVLDARVPRLTIRSRASLPTGSQLMIAGQLLELGATQMPLRFAPGSYQLRVSIPKRAPSEYSLKLSEGGAVEFEIPADTSQPGATPPSKDANPASSRANRWSTLQWTGVGAAGAGVIALGVGGYFALGAASKNSDSSKDCSGDLCGPTGYDERTTAVSRGNMATGFAVAGLALVGAGAALFFIGNDGRRDVVASSLKTRFSLRAAPMGLGGQLLGQF
jgi:hypothetical protein